MRNLRTYFDTPAGRLRAVDDVSFDVGPGDILAIVGESGSGKSVTALSIMRLVPTPPGRHAGGSATMDGVDLLTLPPRDLTAVRGAKLAMIFQNPRAALNPSFTVRTHLVETLRRYRPSKSSQELERYLIATLRGVGFTDPERVAASYPHQLSGGMCQRIGLSLALACEPRILIADEPTTALDVVVQAKILDLLKRTHEERRLPIILITHDFGVVRALANRVIVMYAGKIQESGDVDQVLNRPRHPYTKALIASVPDPENTTGRFFQIRGQPPDLLRLGHGCSFANRCDSAMPICARVQPAVHAAPGGAAVRCHLFAPVRNEAA